MTRVRHRIAVTTPARTVADLRRVVAQGELRRAIRQAGVLGLVIGEDASPDRTRSELERLFLSLCDRFRLPVPNVNVRIGLYTADFLWARRRVVVETDGWRAHRGRLAFEEDHARDLELRLHGYEVLRFTYSQVVDEPARVAAALRARLADERRRDPGA
jgi:very-short-patch-repair endonuclease